MKNSKFFSIVFLLAVIIIVFLVSAFVILKDISSILPKQNTVTLSVGETYIVSETDLKVEKNSTSNKINYDFIIN